MGDSPYSGLEAADWRSLLLRGATFRAIRHRLADLHDLGNQQDSVPMRAILSAIDVSADDYRPDLSHKLAVDLHRSTLSGAVEGLAAGPMSDLERELTLAIAESLGDLSCEDPFAELLAQISVLASAVYGSAWQEPELSIARRRKHPRASPFPDPYAITASTDWDGSSKIELQIVPSVFGPAAFAALPALFTHECICHVPARQRGVADNSSTFAEGFMHWVAVYFLRQWFNRIDPGLSSSALVHCEAFNAVLAQERTAEASVRRTGYCAASELAAHFETKLDLPALESMARTARLGLQLNVVDELPPVKDLLVSKLRLPLSEAVASRLKKWLQGCGDAADLL